MIKNRPLEKITIIFLGQWLMFFDNSIIDEKWEHVVDLYRKGYLKGVQSIKVSTNRETFKCKEMPGMKCHVILFSCGPSDHKASCEAHILLCSCTKCANFQQKISLDTSCGMSQILGITL